MKESTFEDGDKVLVWNVQIRGKQKLADKWESTIHVVVERVGDLPVYKVRPQEKDAPAIYYYPVVFLLFDVNNQTGFCNLQESSIIHSWAIPSPQ